jgi:hypothetical protein
MTPKSFTPAPPLAANLAGGATLIVLPVDDLPDFKGVHWIGRGADGYYRYTDGINKGKVDCPLQVGETYYVREDFEPLEFNDHEVGIVYLATPTEGTRQRNLVYWFHVGEEKALAWQHRSGNKFPAAEMPPEFARTTFTVAAVELRRVNTITEAEAIAAGCLNGGCLNCGDREPCGCDNPKPDRRDGWIWDFCEHHGCEAWDEQRWCWFVSIDKRKGIER